MTTARQYEPETMKRAEFGYSKRVADRKNINIGFWGEKKGGR